MVNMEQFLKIRFIIFSKNVFPREFMFKSSKNIVNIFLVLNVNDDLNSFCTFCEIKLFISYKLEQCKRIKYKRIKKFKMFKMDICLKLYI